MVSLRHLVGRLERSFPGKANGVRTDLVLLLIMSGNDYLPKVRSDSKKGPRIGRLISKQCLKRDPSHTAMLDQQLLTL